MLPICGSCGAQFRKSQSAIRNFTGFSLVEIMVVVSLLSLIVLALMSVFSSTQRAFRASVTQTDILENGRSTMELITADLRGLTPSSGVTSGYIVNACGTQFYVVTNGARNFETGYPMGFLSQKLPGSQTNRLDSVQWLFILGRQNTRWTGTGYFVDAYSTNSINPLYRYYAETSTTNDPGLLYLAFFSTPLTNMTHIMDGVMHFSVSAYSPNGTLLNSTRNFITTSPLTFPCDPPSTNYLTDFFGTCVPAAVELEMGVLEDATRARAESLPNDLPGPPPNDRRTLFLQGQVGAVHLFRQRVSIPNVDLTAYQ